jgi:CheY-like chemotaxis protein
MENSPATKPLHLLYVEDCDIDQRLMIAYLRQDGDASYTLTNCSTLDEASEALKNANYDALILDNRLPPFTNYHEPYRALKEQHGYDGPAIIVSAETSGKEFARERRQDHEVVLDKSDLLDLVRNGHFARLMRGGQPQASH